MSKEEDGDEEELQPALTAEQLVGEPPKKVRTIADIPKTPL